MKINGKCLFCGSLNIGEKGVPYKSGDFLPCHDCGRQSDFDAVLAVVKEESEALVVEQLTRTLKSRFGTRFKT